MFLINLPIEFITFVLTSLAHSLIFLTPFVKFFLDHVDRPCSVPVFNTLGLMITRFSTRMMFYQLVFLTITGLIPLVVLYPLLIIALTVTRKSFTYCTSYVRSAEEVPELQDGRDLSEKLKFLEKALWNSKHIPLTNLLSTFLAAPSKSAKLSALLGIWQLYSEEAPSEQLKAVLLENMFKAVEAVEWVQGIISKYTGEEMPVVVPIEEEPEKQGAEDLFADVEIDSGFLEKNRGLFSLASVFVAVIGAMIPIGYIWNSSEKKTFAAAIIDVGKSVTAKNVIMADIVKAKEAILTMVWSAFGKNYVPDRDIPVRLIQETAVELLRDISAYECALKTDFYGTMREEPINRLSKGIDKIEKMFSDLSAVQKGQYNLTAVIQQVRVGYEALLEKRNSLIVNVTGKQKPVVIHLVGSVGMGKSVYARELIEKLSVKYGITAFFRNIKDEFWSGYAGQQILVWDDIGMRKTGEDYDEFCYHTETAPSTSVGAALKDKGRPTNPLFIITTGNVKYLGAQGHNMVTPHAYHRRRDVVIEMFNPQAAKHMSETGETLKPWQFKANQTICTVFRPVPKEGAEDNANVVGTTSFDRLFEHICELKAVNDNVFKDNLRKKEYFKNQIPENEPEDRVKASTDWLIGKCVSQQEKCGSKDSVASMTLKETERRCEGFVKLPTTSEGKNRCYINCVLLQTESRMNSDQVKRVFKNGPIWYPTVADESAYFAEQTEIFQTDTMGDNYSVANVASHFQGNLCIHMKDRCVYYDMGFDKTFHVHYNAEEQHYSRMEQVKKQTNPTLKTVTTKRPVVLISGPSGAGKTFMAQSLIRKEESVEVSIAEVEDFVEFLKTNKGKNVLIDDITMSTEDYERATRLANAYFAFNQEKPGMLIFTENSEKLKIVENQNTVVEMHRRSHLLKLGFRRTYWNYFSSMEKLALRYQNEMQEKVDKAAVMDTSLSATFKPYSEREVNIQPHDAVGNILVACEKKFMDEVTTETVWKMPLPNTIDFSVDLHIPLIEFQAKSVSQLLRSLYTHELYKVNNFSGRFGVSSAVGVVKQIMNKGPKVPVNNLEQFVLAFNNSQIKADFGQTGSCVLRCIEGSVGLVWNEKDMRMFLITPEKIALVDGKIDLESYFGAESVYRDLCENMIFDPEVVENIEHGFAKLSVESFKENHVLANLLNTLVSLISIGLQIYAPLALTADMTSRCKERNELKYYRKLYENFDGWSGRKGQYFEPFSFEGKNFDTLAEVEEHLKVGGALPVESIPMLSAAVFHIPYGFEKIREFSARSMPSFPIMENARVKFPPTSYEASTHRVNVHRPFPITREVALPGKKATSPNTSSTFYDSAKPSLYENDGKYENKFVAPRIDERVDRMDHMDTTWDVADDMQVDYDERIVWESAGLKTGYRIESSPIKKNNQDQKLKIAESSASSGKDVQKRSVVLRELANSDIVLYTSTYDDFEKVKSIEVPDEHDVYFAYVDSNGYYSFDGRLPSLKCLLYSYVKSKSLKWAVMVCRRDIKSFDALEVLKIESGHQFHEGDIVMVRRSVVGHSYEHYGIIGRNPTGGELSVYHVQSCRGKDITAFIAVDPVRLENWILANRDHAIGNLEIYENFDHLQRFAFMPFPYHVDASNCETWACAMRYKNWTGISCQEVPSYFTAFLEVAKTFLPTKKVPDFNSLIPQREGCIDPTGLNFNRTTILPSSVLLLHKDTRAPALRGIGVKGSFVLTVAHGPEQLIMRKICGSGTADYPIERVWRDDIADVAIYKVVDSKHQSFRDITKNFLTSTELATALAEGTDQVGLLTIPIPNARELIMQTYSARIKGQIHKLNGELFGTHGLEYTSALVGAMANSAYTMQGDCGSPLTLLSSNITGKILGVHRAATSVQMYASVISREKLTKVLDRLMLENSEAVRQCWNERDGIVEDSGIHYTGFPIVGKSIYPPNPCRGTKLRKVKQAPPCLPSEGEPAILSARDPRADQYVPVETTLEAFKREPADIDVGKLEDATDDLIVYFTQKMTGKTLGVLSEMEALNGPSRLQYPASGSLERSSSPGFPLTFRDRTSSKNPYLEQKQVGDQVLWDLADNELGKNLKKDIDVMHAVVGRGERPNLLFTYFPKDEVLAMKKITTPKTRGILASNLPYVVLFRRYFLALHLRFQEMFRDLPIKIGIDCLSSDWNDLANYHLTVGQSGFDADAKSWDASIPIEFMKMAIRFCNGMYRKMDPKWTPQHDRVRSALHMAVERPYVLVGSSVIQLPQGQVSGQPGTAFENSFINILLIVCCFIDIMKERSPQLASVQGFFENCALSVYGDDMMITLSDKVKNEFTIARYTEQAAKYGFTITDANKSGNTATGAVPLEKLSFLKRGFKKIRSSWAGPIELASIGKSVAWIRGSGSYFPEMINGKVQWKISTDIALIRTNFERSLRELCLHDEALFHEYLEQVNRALLDEEESPISADYRGIQRCVDIY